MARKLQRGQFAGHVGAELTERCLYGGKIREIALHIGTKHLLGRRGAEGGHQIVDRYVAAIAALKQKHRSVNLDYGVAPMAVKRIVGHDGAVKALYYDGICLRVSLRHRCAGSLG